MGLRNSALPSFCATHGFQEFNGRDDEDLPGAQEGPDHTGMLKCSLSWNLLISNIQRFCKAERQRRQPVLTVLIRWREGLRVP